MTTKHVFFATVSTLAIVLAGGASGGARGETLSGQVSSSNEPAMEGVLVNLRKEGSTITTTVVSDENGRYSFAAGRLEPGPYTVSIRAAGYVLTGPKRVEIADGAVTADLKLAKARNLAAQLSNAEWLACVPGTDKEKQFLTNCTGCHTLQRVFTAQHDVEEWQQVFLRMGRYSPGSTPVKPQALLPGPRGERPRVRADEAKAAAEFLVNVSQSNPEGAEYELKTLPRPKGPATRVIVTEYDLPRKDAYPHDVIVDVDGHAWYCDFGAQVVGELDPKTGKTSEYELPTLRPEQPKGSLDLQFDDEGNLWVAMMYQAGIAKIDRKTKEVKVYPFPKEWLSASTQASMVSPQNANADGKVWTNNQETHVLYRLDVKTGQFEDRGEATAANGKKIFGYGIPTDKDNNVYPLEFGGTSIGRLDAKTNVAKIWATPSPNSRPRRGRFDDEGRLWFAEYGANAIARFDPATEKFTEWKSPTAWDNPYQAAPSRTGDVWTGSMHSDLVTRLDPKSGQMVQYLLPRTTNIRRVWVDDSGPRSVLWVGSNHGASVVKVEPLE